MDAPPSRYRVVERGRRLVVIDTQSGAPVTALSEPRRAQTARRVETPPTPQRAASPRSPVAGGDPGILTTQPWFDAKAPRRVRVGEGGQKGFAMIAVVAVVVAIFAFGLLGWPALVIGGVLLSQKMVRGALRQRMTRWLDGLEQVAP